MRNDDLRSGNAHMNLNFGLGRNLSEDAGAICACVLDSVLGSVHGLRVSLQQRDEGCLHC